MSLKRGFDFSMALAGLLALGAPMLACALAIRLTSPGPAIFRQTRIGRDERPFTCLKLRTMYFDTPDAPSHKTGANAITPLGRTLRRLKIDEFPQLVNVLRGEMSLVGPRPCLPSQQLLIEERRRYGLARLRPGITGVSQIAGVDMSDEVRLAALDATYLADMSLRRDLQLLLATALGSGRGDRTVPPV